MLDFGYIDIHRDIYQLLHFKFLSSGGIDASGFAGRDIDPFGSSG